MLKIFFKRKYVVAVLYLISLTFIYTSIYASSYIFYPGKEDSNSIISNSTDKTDESSISAIATPEFSFQSEAQILMEASTGTVIYANNENEKLLPASVTKVMTLLILMEHIDSGNIAYTDKVTCSANASQMGGSQIWFKEGETLTIDEALKAICVVSANDVTVAIAEMIGGSESNFVSMMNEKAKELGMENTHFMNSHGIDEDNHYTTAKDIAIMSRELILKHPDILKYTSIWMDTLRNGTFALSSTNKLIRYYEGATGLKTGSTSLALFNLSATATRNNTTFISVIMKAPSSDIRLQETRQLLDYAFANYETKSLCEKGTIIENIKVNKNVNTSTNIVVENNITALLQKGTNVDVTQNVYYNQDLIAPITKNQVVGTIDIINKATGETIGSSNLVIEQEIPKSSILDYLKKMFNVYIINV